MDKLIQVLFGINRMNFWGWVTAGILVFLGSGAFLASSAIVSQNLQFSLWLMSIAIYLVLVGIFGVLMSIYCAMFAEKLEMRDKLVRQVTEDEPLPDRPTNRPTDPHAVR